jgi:hypothetical protein
MSRPAPHADVKIRYCYGWTKPDGDDEVNGLPRGGFVIGWAAKGCGFGELTFRAHRGEPFVCDSEYMGRQSVAAILEALARDCVLECEMKGGR